MPASGTFTQTQQNKCLQKSGGIRMIPQLLIQNSNCCCTPMFWETQKHFLPPKMKWKHHQEVCYWCLELNITLHANTSTWKSLSALIRVLGYLHHLLATSTTYLLPAWGRLSARRHWGHCISDSDLHLLNHNNETNKIWNGYPNLHP